MSSYNNLCLAWNRLKTAQNSCFKNYYRNLFLAYELAAENNLKILSKRLEGHSYEPSDILRFYIPKHSGLHRPVTFLHLDDLIVYQAIANVIAHKYWDDRQSIQFLTVFSNAFDGKDKKSIFLFKPWQECYRKYVAKIKTYFDTGYKWVAHFDLASYYDTIDIEFLSHHISKSAYADFTAFMTHCLSKWTTHKKAKLRHGIPQGPLASSVIGEIYLLPIDKKLTREGINYVRYVDDIKVFGRSKEEVQKAIISLELECKERGLIPHSKKYEIIEANNYQDAIGKYPSIAYDEKHIIKSNLDKAQDIFLRAFDPSCFDITRVKYLLKTIEKNDFILYVVLSSLRQYPELVDEFCIFLSNYFHSEKVAHEIFRNILDDPPIHSYVEGQYWALLSSFNMSDRLRNLLVTKARDRIKLSYSSYPIKYGCYRFICSAHKDEIYRWLLYENSSLLQMMVIPYISVNNEQQYKKFLQHCLMNRSHYDAALAAIKELLYSNKEHLLLDLVAPDTDRSGVLGNTLGTQLSIDPIQQILCATVSSTFNKWAQFLKKDYTHANHLLFLAHKSFHIDKNAWLNYIDSFLDLTLRAFINLIKSFSRITDLPSTIDRKNRLVDYGVLLHNNNLVTNYPDIVNNFQEIHLRRREAPTSHAYDKNTLLKTKPLSSKEQKSLLSNFNIGLTALTAELDKYVP